MQTNDSVARLRDLDSQEFDIEREIAGITSMIAAHTKRVTFLGPSSGPSAKKNAP